MKWIYPNGDGSYREVDYSNDSDFTIEVLGVILTAVITAGIWIWSKISKKI